ncbi:MAG: lactate utilization protein [Halioglobus sp.]
MINVLKTRAAWPEGSANCSEAVKAIGQYLYTHFRSHRLVAGNDPRLAAMPWRDAGVPPRFGALKRANPQRPASPACIAETGAVVTWTGRANPAVNNLLPEHHMVLVDAADLVATMEAAWERINRDMEKHGRPRGINFIAGPSSTADIEGQLVYGAHGPRQWHVMLLGNVPQGALERARSALAMR